MRDLGMREWGRRGAWSWAARGDRLDAPPKVYNRFPTCARRDRCGEVRGRDVTHTGEERGSNSRNVKHALAWPRKA